MTGLVSAVVISIHHTSLHIQVKPIVCAFSDFDSNIGIHAICKIESRELT